ncbi:hypothetical protein HYU09_03305 [Candidatus Woesearchaeota archaeon]|nr:hypothetical protein [Candidatus Woesearchaeota archaeon]
MRTERFLVFSGFVFLLWGIFDIALKSSLYGFENLDYIWFCSITLFVLAFGLILRNSMLLNSFLAMALLVQPFWIADYAWHAFFGTSLNGFASYVFEPNFTAMELIDSFRHMFMIPFGFYAVFMASKKDRKSYAFIPVFITFLLGFSYIFTPGQNNANCVFSACVKNFGGWLSGFGYFVFFLLGTIILSIAINLAIDAVLGKAEKLRNDKGYRVWIASIFLVLLLISFATIAAVSVKFSKTPRYSCVVADSCADCPVELGCKYFYGPKENQTLIYSIKNNADEAYVCDVYMKVLGKDADYKKAAENYFITPGKKYLASFPVGYPMANARVEIRQECTVYEGNY